VSANFPERQQRFSQGNGKSFRCLFLEVSQTLQRRIVRVLDDLGIVLLCNPEGLPLKYKNFAVNSKDVTTIEDIVRKLEDPFRQAERICVMDRGLVSKRTSLF
jgi:hypothetical protein